MAAISFKYPAASSGGGSGSNASVGLNGQTAPTSSTEIGFIDVAGDEQGVSSANPLPTAVLASVLPTGASTATKQDTGNTSLASIDGKTPALGQQLAAASSPVVLTAAQITTLTPLSTLTANQGTANTATNGWPVKITDGTNTAAVKAASTAALATDPAVVVALSPNNNTVANALFTKVTDGINTATVKAGSTAAAAGDSSQVVSLSPNNNTLALALFVKNTDGTNTGAVKAASTAAVAADPSLVVSLSPNNNTLANALFVKNSDGTNTAAVKAASTAPVATDPSLVVTISPNSPTTTSTPTKGTITDGSGSTSATPSTATTAAAINASRKYFFISNDSLTATIWFNFTTAAVASQPSVQLLPGAGFVQEAGFVSTELISIISTTASVPYTLKQA